MRLETRPRHRQVICARRQADLELSSSFTNDQSGASRTRQLPRPDKMGFTKVYSGMTEIKEYALQRKGKICWRERKIGKSTLQLMDTVGPTHEGRPSLPVGNSTVGMSVQELYS